MGNTQWVLPYDQFIGPKWSLKRSMCKVPRFLPISPLQQLINVSFTINIQYLFCRRYKQLTNSFLPLPPKNKANKNKWKLNVNFHTIHSLWICPFCWTLQDKNQGTQGMSTRLVLSKYSLKTPKLKFNSFSNLHMLPQKFVKCV